VLDQRKIKDHYEEESMDYSQLSAYPERSQKLKRFIPVNKLDKSTSLQALSVMAGSPIYVRFIEHLERANKERMGDHYICLSCWCFLDML